MVGMRIISIKRVFNAELVHNHTHAELVPCQPNIMPTMTTMLLQECMEIQAARGLDLICRVSSIFFSSIDNYADSTQGKHGGLLSIDSKSLIPVQGIIITAIMDI
jgi:hypothetical protein